MTDLLAPSMILAAFGLVVGVLWWLAVRFRRRGGDAVMGPFEEIWHPAAQLTRIEVREQAERRAPSPGPSDL
jgi:hypothetical protein